mgnify:CR=1 FL=1
MGEVRGNRIRVNTNRLRIVRIAKRNVTDRDFPLVFTGLPPYPSDLKNWNWRLTLLSIKGTVFDRVRCSGCLIMTQKADPTDDEKDHDHSDHNQQLRKLRPLLHTNLPWFFRNCCGTTRITCKKDKKILLKLNPCSSPYNFPISFT